MDKDEQPFGLIDECIFNMDGECEILTILGVEEHGFEEFGDLLDEDEEVDGPLRLPDSQPQEQQPAVPVEQRQDVSQGAVSSEAIQVREPPGLSLQDPLGGEEPAAALADVAFPEIESVELDDGLILTCESPVKDLRAGCRLLGISQAGSKGKMFERIKKSYVQGMRRAAIDMARAEYQREEHPAQPAHLAARQPTQRERSLHELTHLPYRDWCPFCVSTRARGDYHASHADPDLAAERDRPTIQVDFYFCENRDKSEGSLGVKPILLMVDSWTRYAHAEPIKPKNAKTVGSAISKFVGSLGYVGAVEVCGDNENVLVSGMEFFKQVRARQGFSTTVTTNRNYSKDRTSICERTIQTVCNLQKTLVMQLEESIKCKIPQGHAVLY